MANAPVYICGAARSGTTLVRDLLDGHRELAVLPAEGKFFNAFGQASPATRSDALVDFGQHWVRLLANPNYQQPFWLLGRGDLDDSGYVSFARALLSWNEALGGHDWPFRVQPMVALALAGTLGQRFSDIRRSVDKSPGYEFHLKRIWFHHPQAKIVYLVRNPADVIASCIYGVQRNQLEAVHVSRLLGNVIRSYAAAWRAVRFAPAGGLLLLSYKDLVADREREMARVAAFLDIQFDECLLRQSIAGRPAEPNSSFHGRARRPFIATNMRQRLWLRSATLLYKLLLKSAAGKAR